MALHTSFTQRIQKIIFVGFFFMVSHGITTHAMENSPQINGAKKELIRIYTEDFHISGSVATLYIQAMESFLENLRYPFENTVSIQNTLFRALTTGACPVRGSSVLQISFFHDELASFVRTLHKKRLYYPQTEAFVFQTLIKFYNTLQFEY